MQANPPLSTSKTSLSRGLSWFLMPPLAAAVLLLVLGTLLVVQYQARHQDRVYTGVSVWGVAIGGLDRTEATQALAHAFPYADEAAIIFTDPATGQQWTHTPAEMGVSFDVAATLDAALAVGRESAGFGALREQFEAWYYGRSIPPVVVFDEAQVDAALEELAAEIDRPAIDAGLTIDGAEIDVAAAQLGRTLDRADVRARLLEPLGALRRAQIQLLIHETPPLLHDGAQAVNGVEQIIGSPMTLYLAEPLDDLDLARIPVGTDQLSEWLRVRLVEGADGQFVHEAFIDEIAVRNWLSHYEDLLYREPVNARFYFDDATRELVTVEEHVNGRSLDVEATAALLAERARTGDRSLPFVLNDIVPVAHSDVTAAELGITELLVERTTWFYGSTDERKHNIARSAANFYGILVAPGEEFSFNRYLGEISEEQGYETGLIIFGGRTIEGVGGGVCQVSTTLFQSIFWAGLPIAERWEHGYQVGYYNDGEGPGMDATVYSPIVDFRFTNNTPNYLLIENYYNEVFESLTFKIYSTDIGRTVEKIGPFFDNIREPRPDIWEFNEKLATGEIRQVDWAVEGADVTVGRVVRNYQGDVLIDESHTSNYIPWQNIYEYGPGVDPNNLPANWRDQLADD